MFYIEWCKSHRKAKRTTTIIACPLCLLEDNDRLQRRVLELEAWARKVLEETPANVLPGDLDLYIVER